jgi:hypothetical protein
MSGVVMRCLDTSNPFDAEGAPAPIGKWLRSYDPEAHEGRGAASFTTNLDEAFVFPNAGIAIDAYRAVPMARPFREDGLPNRPLTACTMEFLTVEQAREGAEPAGYVYFCSRCGRASANPNDAAEGYCGACHDWTRDG